ncbi:MAG: MurT ligase domain-containing protein [Solirubrobacterales bacterium]
MNINTLLSIIISKSILKISKVLFKGGTNFPGRVALKLDPNVLKTAAAGYRIILITGTNGKTTTTSMIYNMLKDSGKKVISNNTGANMLPGITACFIEHYSFSKSNEDKYAVIEVDEANLKLITKFITPEIITVTNLFRDQLDRYGEVYTTLKKIMEGIQISQSSKLVLNGDESLLGDLGLNNPCVYYGFETSPEMEKKIDINADAKFCKKCKSPYKYHYLTYNHLGNFYCESCGYKRPSLNYYINEILEQTPEGSLVEINNNQYYINIPGTYNIYNALCAFSIGKELGIENEVIFNSLKSQKSSFGRQETIDINGKQVKIILVKNPAGYDQAINTVSLDKRQVSLAVLLNDNYADGRDVSWIWDVKFEKLTQLDLGSIVISGLRLYDMAIRLKIAGLPEDKFFITESYEELLNALNNTESNIIYILATYTAMINLRKFLKSKGHIKELW